MDAATIYQTVNTRYSAIASDAHSDNTVYSKNTRIASLFGYSADELANLPSGTNLGVSCGNPLTTASLKPSETMVDLGSGGGLDCLIAANHMLKADPTATGKIYGIDRSESMIALARKNVAKASLPAGLIKYIHASIADIPLQISTVDLVVSNCVINLVPNEDKPKVFRRNSQTPETERQSCYQ